jgi:ribonucleoside-diphosphate reductase alpha chain
MDNEDCTKTRVTEDAQPMVATRRSLPSTRQSITHKFSVSNYEGYLTIGIYDDGTPGEIFIKVAKEGSALSGMCQAFCRAFSIALQHGLSVDDAVTRFKGMRFEPMGATSNPAIPEAQSLVDYVARYLELEYGSNAPANGPMRR